MTDYNIDPANGPGSDGDAYRDASAGARELTGSGVDDRERGFPWPPQEDESIVSAFGRTWQGASLTPAAFFARMPERGSLGAALLYYLAIGIAVAGVQLFLATLRGTAAVPRETTADVIDSALAMSPLVNFLLSPVLLLIMLFVSAAAVHALLKLLGGTRYGYLFTVRTFCFTYSPAILGMIPWIGGAIGFVWMVVIAIPALRAGHGTTTGRAATAVIVPVIALIIFFAITFLAAYAAGLLKLPV